MAIGSAPGATADESPKNSRRQGRRIDDEVLAHIRPPRAWFAQLHGGLPPRNTAEYAGLFEHAELAVQPDTGHSRWLDDPAWLTRMLVPFLG